MVDIIERVIDVEFQLGAAAQLVTHLLRQLVADAAFTGIDVVDDSLGILAGEDAKAHVGYTQVG